jgi:hypothetical protein
LILEKGLHLAMVLEAGVSRSGSEDESESSRGNLGYRFIRLSLELPLRVRPPLKEISVLEPPSNHHTTCGTMYNSDSIERRHSTGLFSIQEVPN